MKIVVFNGQHELDLPHEMIYFTAGDLTLLGVEEIVKLILDFKPDLMIEEEKNDGVSIYTEVYKKLTGIQKAYWLIDGHCNLIDHVVYAKQFDFVFCAQSWFVPIIQREVLNKVFYLPLCHTQTLTEYREMLATPVEKDIDLSFVGNIRSIHVERKKYVGRFLELYDGFFARKSDYNKTLEYLRRSKSTFNCSLNNDLNFRVWEALACGTVIVTDNVIDIDRIYGLRNHLTVYDKLIPDWLNLSLPSASDTQGFIMEGHTMTHRMFQLLEMIETGDQIDYANKWLNSAKNYGN